MEADGEVEEDLGEERTGEGGEETEIWDEDGRGTLGVGCKGEVVKGDFGVGEGGGGEDLDGG